MTKPTPEQVTKYAKSIGFHLDGEEFCAYYGSQGWKKANGLPLTSWKLAVYTWKRGEQKKTVNTKTRQQLIAEKNRQTLRETADDII